MRPRYCCSEKAFASPRNAFGPNCFLGGEIKQAIGRSSYPVLFNPINVVGHCWVVRLVDTEHERIFHVRVIALAS